MKILKQAELMQIIDAINNNADLDENIFDNDKSVSVRQIYFVVRSIDRNVDRNSPKCKKILRMMVEHSAIIVNRGNNGTKSFDDTDRKAYEADKRKDLIKKLEKIASIDDLMSEEEKSLEDFIEFIETEEEVAEVTAFSQGEQQVPIDENVIPEEGQTSKSGTEDVLDMLKIGPKYDHVFSQEKQPTDPLLMDAIRTVLEAGQASTSLLQRRLRVGHARAGRIIEEMEKMGIVSEHKGAKSRDVLITVEDFNQLKMGQKSEITGEMLVSQKEQADEVIPNGRPTDEIIAEAGNTATTLTEPI